MTAAVVADRPRLIVRVQRLEYLTVGWDVIEGVVADALALVAGFGRAPWLRDRQIRRLGLALDPHLK